MAKGDRWFNNLLLNAYWFGLSFMWIGLHPILLPIILLGFADETKNTLYGLLTFVGLLVALVTQPLSGALSDYTRHRLGRRRPWMLLGALLGLVPGFLVAKLGIPAFVASLAGFLIYRGAILVVTEGSGTIIINNKVFNAIGNGFIPDIPVAILPGIHKLTLLLGIAAIAFLIYREVKGRGTKLAYGFEVLPMSIFVLKLVSMAVLVGGMTWVLANYNGLSWTVVVMLIVLLIYNFVTTQTVLGRHIYAVGGNPEAAQLSGVNVKRITYLVFSQMAMLAGLSGMLFASRLQSATTTAGTLFELDAIAAAFVGGVSAAGGVGRVTGAVIGALVMASLTSGMNLMGIGISYQYIVRGVVLALAVIFDVATRNR